MVNGGKGKAIDVEQNELHMLIDVWRNLAGSVRGCCNAHITNKLAKNRYSKWSYNGLQSSPQCY